MEKYPEIIMALEACGQGEFCPTDCPYKLRGRDGRSCRATLCIDAAKALAAEEMRADEYQEQSAVNAARANENMTELCRTEGECEALRAEAEKLREELKNRPEVGFDERTFDATLEAVKEVDYEATYWHGYADALKWFIHDRFEKGQEGGDDV